MIALFLALPAPCQADPTIAAGHQALLQLLPVAKASHVAARDGAWDNPLTWDRLSVPGPGARVHIPMSRTVTYNASSGDELAWLRVDGFLKWSVQRSTKLVVETIAVMPAGRIEIGTTASPLPGQYTAEIEFPDNGPIDRDLDPTLLSRGLISHGRAEIVGALKQSWVPVNAVAHSGSRTLTVASPPFGWRTGDTVVVTGTQFVPDTWNSATGKLEYQGTQDEVMTIASVSGNTVTFTAPFRFKHQPRDARFHYCAGNYTRNIRFASKNGAATPTQQRGHVMFMHSPTITVKYAEFFELGRTDKSTPIDDVGINRNGTPGRGTNRRGRYALHLHRMGSSQLPAALPWINGCAVFGSPGWGFVGHDSVFGFYRNVSYNVLGSGFVAEDGTETAAFVGNLAITGRGDDDRHTDPKHVPSIDNDDDGFSGHGFWFKSRNLIVTDNVAAGFRNAAFFYFHRGSPRLSTLKVPANMLLAPYPAIAKGRGATSASGEYLTIDDTPIWFNSDNTAFANHKALHVIKANPVQGHDIRNTIVGFTGWENRQGIENEYTREYTYIDLTLVADSDGQSQWNPAVTFGTWARGMNLFNASIEGYRYPFLVTLTFNGEPDNTDINLVGCTIKQGFKSAPMNGIASGVVYHRDGAGNLQNGFDAALHHWVPRSTLVPGRLGFLPHSSQSYALPASLPWNYTFSLVGTRIDSIGAAGYQSDWSGPQLSELLARDGYFTDSAGNRYLLLTNYVSERLVNAALLHRFAVQIHPNYTGTIGPNRGRLPGGLPYLSVLPVDFFPATRSPAIRQTFGLPF